MPPNATNIAASVLAVPSSDRFLRMREILRLVPACPATIYNWINAGTFPKPCRLGPRRVGWKLSDIEGWIQSREAA